MGTYAIGDIQGCADCLRRLISSIPEHQDNRFWFVGDLVNRGPESLATLQLIRALGDSAVCVLGNHDLHLLATAAGVRKPSRRDTLSDILDSPDRQNHIDWLRQQSLAVYENGCLLVHAGVHPDWSKDQCIDYAGEVSDVLSGDNWIDFLRNMYGDTPARWHAQLRGDQRLRAIVNVLTRMRFIDAEGVLDMSSKGGVNDAPNGFRPWFDAPNRVCQHTTIVFGHWSTVGLMVREHVIALDTGCVWGGELSAIRLQDRQLFQLSCQQFQDPAPD